MTRAYDVSAGTVLRALERLEAQGSVRSRPRSGYYVAAAGAAQLPAPAPSTPDEGAKSVNACEMIYNVLRAARDVTLVPFGSPFPAATLFPLRRLATALQSATRKLQPE